MGWRESLRGRAIPWVYAVASNAAGIQQNRGQHHQAIFLPFPLMDSDGHACRVDIADAQTGDLGAPQAGGVDGHQQGTAFEMQRCGEYPCHFLPAKDQGESRSFRGKGMSCSRNARCKVFA